MYAELRAGQRLPLVAPPQPVRIGGVDPLHLALQTPATIATFSGTVSNTLMSGTVTWTLPSGKVYTYNYSGVPFTPAVDPES